MKKVIIGIIIGLIIILGISFYAFNNQFNQTNQAGSESVREFQNNEHETQKLFEQEENISKKGTNTAEEQKTNCPESISLKTPVDLSLATSILYPGQYRGSDYKPHGGFRFDNSKTTDITIYAPMKSYVTSGSKYLEGGEVQYLFEFEDDCNVKYRFDHLRTLSPKLAEIAESFPGPFEGDSRTTTVNRIEVGEMEILATEVGIPGNVFVDFGVYDYNKPNEISKDESWLNQDTNEPQATHGVCWFDLLNKDDATIVKNLQATGVEGKTSDYC